jgi:hypothetical protein
MISDSDYTEFENFTKWLGVTQWAAWDLIKFLVVSLNLSWEERGSIDLFLSCIITSCLPMGFWDLSLHIRFFFCPLSSEHSICIFVRYLNYALDLCTSYCFGAILLSMCCVIVAVLFMMLVVQCCLALIFGYGIPGWGWYWLPHSFSFAQSKMMTRVCPIYESSVLANVHKIKSPTVFLLLSPKW